MVQRCTLAQGLFQKVRDVASGGGGGLLRGVHSMLHCRGWASRPPRT